MALGALARMGALTSDDVAAGLADPDPAVRRRACELGGRGDDEIGGDPEGRSLHLVRLLSDSDPTVAEAAAWALGERGRAQHFAVSALAAMATGHPDALCREAAVAALGAIGDDAGLPAVLAATEDRAAVRRRAVIALAAFSGTDVEAALRRALSDRDWQVRQAAEDLSS